MENSDQHRTASSREVALIQWEIDSIRESLTRNRLIATVLFLGYVLIITLFSIFFLSYVVSVTSFTHIFTFGLTLLLMILYSVSIILLISGFSSPDYIHRADHSETVADQPSSENYYSSTISWLKATEQQLLNDNSKLIKKIKNSVAISGSATIIYSIYLVFTFFH